MNRINKRITIAQMKPASCSDVIRGLNWALLIGNVVAIFVEFRLIKL
jgi:hypothetical protein